MSHVFISYSSKDEVYALQLDEDLKRQGFQTWIAKVNLRPGERWEHAIPPAIENCAAFIVIMTPEAHASEWVLNECDYAQRKNKQPFPLLLKGECFFRYLSRQHQNVIDGSLPVKGFYDELAKCASRSANGLTPQTHYSAPLTAASPAVELPPPPDVSGILPPPFDWCYVPPGYVNIKQGVNEPRVTKEARPFYIAKYPITNLQFDQFVNFSLGYTNLKWWNRLPRMAEWRDKYSLCNTAHQGADLPRTNVSFYEAFAFCSWLNEYAKSKNGFVIRLPSDYYWQRAAEGNEKYIYPWGHEFDAKYCNTLESKLDQPTPVTRYPSGASPCGAMDMAGNVREWCWTEVENGRRVLRGGAFNLDQTYATCTFHDSESPDVQVDRVGFRIIAFPF